MRKLLTILLLWSQIATFAANQYVDPSFTGTSNGTITNPWKAWSSVNQSALNPGDSVLFKRGQKYTSGQITITRSGNSTNPIVFGAYGTGTNPLFWGNGGLLQYLFYMSGRSYIVFDGLTISDTTISPTDRTVQSIIRRGVGMDNSQFITVKNCKIDRVGVAIYMTGNNNTVQGCDIGNLRMVVNTNDNGDNDYGANPLVISSSYNLITGNYFHDCWAVSFDYGVDGGAIDIYADRNVTGNVISYNTLIDCNGVIEIGGTGFSATNTVLAYNKCINNGSTLYVSNSGNFTTIVDNVYFYNNVIVESEPYRLIEPALFSFKSTQTTPNSLILKNNVIQLYGTIDVCRSQWAGGGLVHENNIYKLGTGSVLNFSINASERTTSGTLWESTLGRPESWNYTPAAGSLLIDFGLNLGYTTDFIGKAITGLPDAGIIERTAPVTQPFKALLKFVE